MADTGKMKKGSAAGGRQKNTKKNSQAAGNRKSSSAASKKTGASGRSAGSFGAKKGESRLRDEITAILLIAAGMFLIVSVMTTAAGKFGEVLSHGLKGLFGVGAYILPFYIILYGLLILLKRMARVSGRSIFFLVLMYIDLVTLNAVRFDAVKIPQFSGEYLKNMYDLGSSLESAGAVGMGIGWLAVKGIGTVGLVIVCSAVLIVSLLLLVNTPISAFLDHRREKKYQHALDKEAAEEEARNRAREIEEQKAKLREERARISASDREKRGRETAVFSEPGFKDEGVEGILPGAEMTEERAERDSVSHSRKNASPVGDAFDRLKIKSMNLFRGDGSQSGGSKQPLADNKRQILEYMKDDSLFDGGAAGVSGRGLYGLTEEDSVFPREKYGNFSDLGMAETEAEEEKDLCRAFDAEKLSNMCPSMIDDNDVKGGTPEVAEENTETENFSADISGAQDGAENASGLSSSVSARRRAGQAADSKLSKAEVEAAMTAGAAEVANQANQTPAKKPYRLPPPTLLNAVKKKENRNLKIELAAKAHKLETVLRDFGVSARVIDVKQGPSVTRYEIQPDSGVKVNSIVRLANDIALNLEAKSLRIEAPIPGKAAVGIEVENEKAAVVTLREMIESPDFQKAESKISFVVGEDIAGNSIVADLKGMPHLLIAGSTGSGKSVCINSIIMSMLYKSTPDEVKFILIDPKVVELGNYNGIPHMLIPVVTDPSKAAAALAWAVQEMNDRYRKFAESSVRDLKSYNSKMKREDQPENVLPQIVIIIDELADLMMAAPSQVEESICRLAQLARAAGMHLIVATQRPSVDIVTGLIKANIPSRIAFAVSSQVDSRTILDRAGAEKLVGKGDMLFNPIGKAQAERLQGPFVTDEEVNAVIEFWKAQAEESDGPNRIMESINTVKIDIGDEEEEDELLNDAIELVVNAEQASASMLQRRFRIGYNRAGRLVDIMESRGIIGPSEGSKPRRVLVSKEEFYGAPTERAEDGGILPEDQPFSDQITGEQET